MGLRLGELLQFPRYCLSLAHGPRREGIGEAGRQFLRRKTKMLKERDNAKLDKYLR